MKKENSSLWKNFKIFFLTGVVVLLIIVLFLLDFSAQVNKQIQRMTEDHLVDVGRESAYAIQNEMSQDLAEIQYLAEYMSRNPDLSREERELLTSQIKEKCHFTAMCFVSEDGVLYSEKQEPLPKTTGDYVDRILDGESGMTDTFTSENTGTEMFVFYAPVKTAEKVSGGIVGSMVISKVTDLFVSTGFGNNSYSYIIKPDGTIVVQTSHSFSLYNGRDFFEFLDTEAEDGTLVSDELKSQMEKKESGLFSYRVGLSSRIGYYAPAHVNGWYVLSIVPYDVMNQYQKDINITALYLTIKIVIFFLILAALIVLWFQKAEKIILESKNQLEMGKNKLELALKHTVNTIFEYKIEDDSLVFIAHTQWSINYFPNLLPEVSKNCVEQGLIANGYKEKFQEVLKQVSAGNITEPEEFLGGFKFKEEFWFRLTVSPVKNGNGEVIEAIGTIEDITEEKRTKRRFAQEEQYRETLLSEAVAMWSVDLREQKLHACTLAGKNRMGERNNMLYSDKFIYKICQGVHPVDRERIYKFVQISNMLAAYYVGKQELKEQFRFLLPDAREYIWVSCTISLLSEPTTGNPVAFAYVRNVDEEKRLADTSERDPLTGLHNRRNLSEKIDWALEENKGLSCLLMMDLDEFKEVNDKYGHQEGDRVLKQMAGILEGAFRTDDLVARFGGDEFIIFLDCLPDKDCAYNRAEAVRRMVLELPIEHAHHTISVSIGMAFAPEDGNTFTQLYKRADEALYVAKGRGKNQIAYYEYDMHHF